MDAARCRLCAPLTASYDKLHQSHLQQQQQPSSVLHLLESFSLHPLQELQLSVLPPLSFAVPCLHHSQFISIHLSQSFSLRPSSMSFIHHSPSAFILHPSYIGLCLSAFILHHPSSFSLHPLSIILRLSALAALGPQQFLSITVSLLQSFIMAPVSTPTTYSLRSHGAPTKVVKHSIAPTIGVEHPVQARRSSTKVVEKEKIEAIHSSRASSKGSC